MSAPSRASWRHLLTDLPTRLRRPTSGVAYRPEIDGLRFIAISVVVVGHLAERLVRLFPHAHAAADGTLWGTLVQRPGLGVYLFFAVSGFILATQAARAAAHPLSPTFLRRYFARRVLRIEPPYMLLLVATFLTIEATGLVPDGTNQFATAPASLAQSLAGSLLYMHDLVWGTYPRLFPPGWSLEVEVQFYVVAPLLFAAWFAVPRGRARLALGVAGLVVGSLSSLLAPATIGPAHVATSLLRFFHFFWLGLVLADAQDVLTAHVSRIRPAMMTSAGVVALALYLVLPDAPAATTPGALAAGLALRAAALACVAILFAAALAPRTAFRAVCANGWVSLIGGACYSLYLTHLQLIQAMTLLAAKIAPQAPGGAVLALALLETLIVVAAGLAFYAAIERPFMRPDWPMAAWQRLRLRRPAAA